MLEHQAAAEHVELKILVLEDPTEKDLLDQLKEVELIFTTDKIFEPGILTVRSVKLEKLLAKSALKVERVRE